MTNCFLTGIRGEGQMSFRHDVQLSQKISACPDRVQTSDPWTNSLMLYQPCQPEVQQIFTNICKPIAPEHNLKASRHLLMILMVRNKVTNVTAKLKTLQRSPSTSPIETTISHNSPNNPTCISGFLASCPCKF